MSLGKGKASLHLIKPEVSFQDFVAERLAVPNKTNNHNAYQRCP
jgi:hypothetical protein